MNRTIALIRRTTHKDDAKKLLDFYITREVNNTISIPAVKRSLGWDDRRLWETVDYLYCEYLDFISIHLDDAQKTLRLEPLL